MSAAVECHACGYDIRAQLPDTQSPDAKCPECGTPVADSLTINAIPRRPAWRDSDPRWRRRMLAGVWVLVLLPLFPLLLTLHNVAAWNIPTPFDFKGALLLKDTFLVGGLGVTPVFSHVVVCIGFVLLFSSEHGRRQSRWDRTRSWGVAFCYLLLFLGLIGVGFRISLGLAGISSLLLSMPPEYQPSRTSVISYISWAYLRYGPHPTKISYASFVFVSSVVVLLACIQLFNALRSSGPRFGIRVLAVIVLAPLVLTALAQAVYAVRYATDFAKADDLILFGYFDQWLLKRAAIRLWSNPFRLTVLYFRDFVFMYEASKSLSLLIIALWLTVAQFAAMRHRRGITQNPVLPVGQGGKTTDVIL